MKSANLTQIVRLGCEKDADVRPWHHAVFGQLCSSYHSRGLPHALMLAGPQFVGKAAFSKQLARVLLCLDPLASGPCNRCKPCQLTVAGTHPDWLHISPEEPGKLIRIDTIRELQAMLQQTPQQGGNKVCTIDPAESLNDNSANGLLKILEEPPANTYFILTSHRAQKLLPTIRSRCQRVSVGMPDQSQVGSWLAGQFSKDGIGPEAISQALQLSRGFPEKARALLLDQPRSENYYEILVNVFTAKQSALDAARAVDSSEYPTFLDAFLYWTQGWLKNERAEVSADTCLHAIPAAAKQRIYQKVVGAKIALQGSANARLLFEALFIECLDIYHHGDIESRR